MNSAIINILHRKYRVLVPIMLATVIFLGQIIPLLFSKGDLSGLSDRQFIEHLDQYIPALMENYSVPLSDVLDFGSIFCPESR